MEARMVSVEEERLPQLLGLLETDLPATIHPYCFLRCVMDWKKKRPSIVSEVLAPDSNFDDSTFMLYTILGEMFTCTAYSRSKEGRKRLEDGMMANWLNLRPEGCGYLFTGLNRDMEDVVTRVLTRTLADPQEFRYSNYELYWMSLDEASQIPARSVPEGLRLEHLEPIHAAQINGIYPHRYPGSEVMIEANIAANGGLGLFRGRHLVSWAMASYYLGLGVVQTLIDERRQGLGEHIVRETSRMIATQLRVPVHLMVFGGNQQTCRFFQRIGFKRLCSSIWILQKSNFYQQKIWRFEWWNWRIRDYRELLGLLEADLPTTIHPFCFLKCLMRWRMEKPSIISGVLAPDGDFTDSTFMLYTIIGEMFFCTVYSKTAEGRRRLEEGMVTNWVDLRPQRCPYLFTCLTRDLEATVTRVLARTLADPEEFHCSHDTVFWMPAEEASLLPAISVPEGVHLEPLDSIHAAQIDGVYRHRYPGSEEMMTISISLNGGLGLFRDHRLVSWAMASFYLGLGVVQTLKEERKRGMGEYVVRETTRMIATRLGVPVHLNVIEGNHQACRFFQRIGFKRLYTSTWIYLKTRKVYEE